MSAYNRLEKAGTRRPFPVADMQQATVVTSATATITLDAGDAGDRGEFVIGYSPVASLLGDRVGAVTDSSLVITGTALTDEVSFSTLNGRSDVHYSDQEISESSTALYDNLENGEYIVIYETGKVFYRRATDSASVGIAYKYRSIASNLQVGDIQIGAVEIKNSNDDTRATVGGNGLHVDVQASVLPTGAATEATVATLATEATVATLATEATLSGLDAKITACDTGAVVISSQPAITESNDAIAIYGSDDGGITKRIIKTDAGGAIQVDLEVSSVEITGDLPDTATGDLAAIARESGGNLDAIAGDIASVDSKITACDTTPLATEATVATLATEATAATLATEATVVTLATEATLSGLNAKITACDTTPLATEATAATLATEATAATLATEATAATLATEATAATLATEATSADIKTAVEALAALIDGGAIPVSMDSASTGTPFVIEAADETVTEVKAAPGSLMSVEASNPNDYEVFIQLFDATTPIAGTTAPVQSLMVPAGNAMSRGGIDTSFSVPMAFSNSIKFAITTTPFGLVGPDLGITVNFIYG